MSDLSTQDKAGSVVGHRVARAKAFITQAFVEGRPLQTSTSLSLRRGIAATAGSLGCATSHVKAGAGWFRWRQRYTNATS